MSKNTAGSVTAVSVATTDTPIVSANLGRIEITIVNTSANIVDLAFGITAVAANGVRLAAGASYTTTNWKGAIRGIAQTGASVVTVAEF
jgi:predicted ester cyclase